MFLWHFPAGRPARLLAGIAALWRPDFPPPRPWRREAAVTRMTSGVIIAHSAGVEKPEGLECEWVQPLVSTACLQFSCPSADNPRMNWLDIVLLLLVVGIGGLGMKRGFGRSAFDAAGLYAALAGAAALAPMLAAHLTLAAGGASVNKSWAFGLLFVALTGVGLAVAWLLAGTMPLNAGIFDKLLGLAAGLAAGAIVAHALLSTLVTADPHRVASAALVRSGSVGTELYSFPTYHSAMDTITGAKSYRRSMTGDLDH